MSALPRCETSHGAMHGQCARWLNADTLCDMPDGHWPGSPHRGHDPSGRVMAPYYWTEVDGKAVKTMDEPSVADQLMDAYVDLDLIVYGGPPHMRPGYVYKPEPPTEHHCDLPAEWILGAVWRCREGHLWVVDDACACRGRMELHCGRGSHMVGLAWRPATWWQRRRHGGRKVLADMANENQEQAFARLKPPPPQGRGASSKPPPPNPGLESR